MDDLYRKIITILRRLAFLVTTDGIPENVLEAIFYQLSISSNHGNEKWLRIFISFHA